MYSFWNIGIYFTLIVIGYFSADFIPWSYNVIERQFSKPSNSLMDGLIVQDEMIMEKPEKVKGRKKQRKKKSKNKVKLTDVTQGEEKDADQIDQPIAEVKKEEPVLISVTSEKTDPVCKVVECDSDEITIPEVKITVNQKESDKTEKMAVPKEDDKKPTDSTIKTPAKKPNEKKEAHKKKEKIIDSAPVNNESQIFKSSTPMDGVSEQQQTNLNPAALCLSIFNLTTNRNARKQEKYLRRLFSEYGPLKSVEVVRYCNDRTLSQGYGYVIFANEKDALVAQLTMQWEMPQFKVFVGNWDSRK